MQNFPLLLPLPNLDPANIVCSRHNDLVLGIVIEAADCFDGEDDRWSNPR
jgi:hypothetical protein